MTVYALRLQNGTDTADRVRKSHVLDLFPTSGLGGRSGVRNGDSGGVVTVVAGTMSVQVSPFVAWIDGTTSNAQGGYPFVSDATEALVLADGHATLSRTDVIAATVRDNTHDGSGFTDARLIVVQGTPGAGAPALPASALGLREVTVPAGLSAGTGGLASGNLGTDLRTYLPAGVVSVASTVERDALAVKPTGGVVYRADTKRLEVYDGTAWKEQAELLGSAAAWRLVANTFSMTNPSSYTVIPNATERTAVTATLTKRQAGTAVDITLQASCDLTSGVAQAGSYGVRINGTDYDMTRFWHHQAGQNASRGQHVATRRITGLPAGALTIEPVFKAGASTFTWSNTVDTISWSAREVVTG